MKKFCNGFILLFLMISLSMLTAAVCYASDDPAYDKAYEVYQNQGGIQAMPMMKQCAENGSIPAMWILGWIYIHDVDGSETNYSDGAAWMTKYMRAPVAPAREYAIYELASLYWRGGHGLGKDLPYSRYLFELLAEPNWTGDGTREPRAQLVKLTGDYILADTKNDPDYEKAGNAFKKNRPKDALPLLKQSAENKNKDAMEILGMMYKCGLGTKQDYAEAASWYKKAAENGSSYAMLNMAKLYENGRGVAKDEVQAKDWYKKSIIAGNKEAKFLLEEKIKKEPLDQAGAIEIVKMLKYSREGAPWGTVINKVILKPKWEYYYNDKDGHVVKLRGYYEDAQKEKSSITIAYVLECTPHIDNPEKETRDYYIKGIYSAVKNGQMAPGIPDWLAFELE